MQPLTPADRDWFQRELRDRLRDSTGDAFQKLFEDIMGLLHPGDFTTIKPWGNVGDRKCDGYLPSEERLFQCYAPERMESAPTCDKIEEDFIGALKHWPTMERWVFVHNQHRGLPPQALQALRALGAKHPTCALESWEPATLESRVAACDDFTGLSRLLGYPPSPRGYQELGIPALMRVLEGLQHAYSQDVLPSEAPIQPVPVDKLDRNQLSTLQKRRIREAEQADALVERLFQEHPRPMLGEEVANVLRGRYTHLKEAGLPPEEICRRLQSFVGGRDRGDEEYAAGVWALLAYFFSRCDIFEATGATQDALTHETPPP